MKKVLHVIDALNVGGAQELLALMAKHKGSAFEMSVCVLQPSLDLQAKIESHGVRVFALNRKRCSVTSIFDFLKYSLGSMRDIVRICREEHVDVLHAHLSDAEFLCYFASLFAINTKFCVTVHTPRLLPDGKGRDLRKMARRLLLRLVYGMADKVIAVSKDIATVLRENYGVNPPKLITIVNGVETGDLARFQPGIGRDVLGLKDDESVVLCVGRLAPQKGYPYLLEALRLLVQRVPNVKLLVAGDGGLDEELRQMALTLGLADRVQFLGFRTDIHSLLAMSDVYVCASIFEGTSLAMMEAMAAGKTIVATDIPGNTELLVQGVNALLVPAADASGLAKGLERVLKDAGLAKELGRKAREMAQEEFDIRVVIRNYVDAWGI